ncbi:uncharacterized protein LOC111112685 isoform X4 [Crassostrea virginica]
MAENGDVNSGHMGFKPMDSDEENHITEDHLMKIPDLLGQDELGIYDLIITSNNSVGSVVFPMEQVDTTNSVVVKPNLQVMEPESSLNTDTLHSDDHDVQLSPVVPFTCFIPEHTEENVEVLQTEEATTSSAVSAGMHKIIDVNHNELAITPSAVSPKRRRSTKGKFVKKTTGTLEQLRRREKDRDRKRFDSTLKVFKTLAKASISEEGLSYFCVLRRKNGDIHYSATEDFNQKFVDNKPIMDYKESAIETRRESLIKKINISSVVSQAVEPSPSKGPSSMSFLPGLGAFQRQSLTEIQFNLSHLPEDAVALDKDIIHNIKKRIWVRKNRQAQKKSTVSEEQGDGPSMKGKGKGRGKKPKQT